MKSIMPEPKARIQSFVSEKYLSRGGLQKSRPFFAPSHVESRGKLSNLGSRCNIMDVVLTALLLPVMILVNELFNFAAP